MKNLIVVKLVVFVIDLTTSLYAYEQKPFVIIITSYNNAQWYKKNLSSVFSQKYDNYRALYIDDASTDGTPELVDQYIQEYNQPQRITVLKNSIWRSQMANHYAAVHSCKDEEIIVHLDGDDWFIDNQVLSYLNNIYSNEDIWLTYGQYKMWPSNKKGHCKKVSDEVIAANGFRDTPWLYSHLRTFYAGLFKQIKLQDLLMMGTFKIMSPTPDLAFMYPMLEMAGIHVKFISKPLYVYNKKNSLSQKYIFQQVLEKEIQHWPRYSPIKNFMGDTTKSAQERDIAFCINAQHGPETLRLCLESIHNNMPEIRQIYIFCIASHKNIYNEVAKKKLATQWIYYNEQPDYATALAKKNIDYIVYTHDGVKLTESIDCDECLEHLEKTDAYAFDLLASKSNLECSDGQSHCYCSLSATIGAWHNNFVNYVWRESSTVIELQSWLYKNCKESGITVEQREFSLPQAMRLYRINDFLHTPSERQLTLFYKTPKAVSIIN